MTELSTEALQGTYPALVTPFRDGKVDEEGYRNLIRFQLDNGVDGLVACGTTGEAATLAADEYERVVSIAVEEAGSKVPVIVGTGSNSTQTTIETTSRVTELGADGALIVTPYYNKPTQEGLFRHYEEILGRTDVPVVLYNVPSRTGCNLSPHTAARLADHERVVGLKEATGDLKQGCQAIELCGKRVAVLSGEDFLTYPLVAVGGKGVISVVANVAPKGFGNMVSAALRGEMKKARELHYRYMDLAEALFLETNPVPAKTALAMMDLIEPDVRLPLCPMSGPNREQLAEVLRRHELLDE